MVYYDYGMRSRNETIITLKQLEHGIFKHIHIAVRFNEWFVRVHYSLVYLLQDDYISLRIVSVCICIVPVGHLDHFARCYMTAWSNWLLKHQRHSIVYSWIELRPCVSRMTWFGLTPVFVGHIPRLADKTNAFSGDETHNSSHLCKYSRYSVTISLS